VGESVAMAIAQIQKARIWSDREGLLLQMKEFFVHTAYSVS
jgi:hypothetical protein